MPDAVSYTWTISGGAKFVGSATGNSVKVNFSTATSATAVITVKANNACGSSAAASATIAVSGTYAAKGTGNNYQPVEELTAKALDYVVYPNPAKDQFNISFNTKSMDKIAFVVMDLKGRVLYTYNNTYGTGPQMSKIDVSKLTNGLYLVRILKNGEEEKIVKIVVQH